MQVQDSVKKMTLTILCGEILLTAIMLLAFLFLGRFDGTVLLGAMLGAFFAVLNFFLMGLSVQKAAAQMNGAQANAVNDGEADGDDMQPDRPLSPQAQEARKRMQLSYGGRMLMLVAVAVLGLTLPVFHPLAVVIPMLFPRVVIMAQGLWMKKEA